MISQDTIRTVIEIVPGWGWNHDNSGLFSCPWPLPEWHPDDLTDLDQTVFLDALAAASVSVIDKKGYAFAVVWPKDTSILRNEKGNEQLAYHEGPNRTENTLLAIAEFVKGGGFDG